jgi:hypothetical protein
MEALPQLPHQHAQQRRRIGASVGHARPAHRPLSSFTRALPIEAW